MEQQQHLRRLPALTEYRLRRLRVRLPLEILAAQAGIPSASLSRFERGAGSLTPEQSARLEAALAQSERSCPE
jgi:hypothetical protein